MTKSDDDVLEWADGTWCFVHEIEQMGFMSDDYKRIPYMSQECQGILKRDGYIE